jgi:hypothetical protein
MISEIGANITERKGGNFIFVNACIGIYIYVLIKSREGSLTIGLDNFDNEFLNKF